MPMHVLPVEIVKYIDSFNARIHNGASISTDNKHATVRIAFDDQKVKKYVGVRILDIMERVSGEPRNTAFRNALSKEDPANFTYYFTQRTSPLDLKRIIYELDLMPRMQIVNWNCNPELGMISFGVRLPSPELRCTCSAFSVM